MEIVIWALCGLAAGGAARFMMARSTPGGLFMPLTLGLGGAVIGAWLGRLLGFYRAGESVSFVMAVIGAVIALTIFDFVATRR